MNIYYICPDLDTPSGGTKQIYRHVDILNRNGFSAFVLHKKKDFRISFFENSTKVVHSRKIFEKALKLWIDRVKDRGRLQFAYAFWERVIDFLFPSDIQLKADDILVVPEIYGPRIGEIAPGIRKIIFNQNSHYTFDGYSSDLKDKQTPYHCPEVLATLVVSEHSLQSLRYVFPDHFFSRIHNGVDKEKFVFKQEKKPQIAYMPRKLSEDALYIINSLKFRDAFHNFEFVEIDNLKENEAAAVLRESLIFLSFSDREGCPLPPMEAMACGCLVVGYHGFGGQEYFSFETGYPVPQRDVLCFSQTLERVIEEYLKSPELILEKRKKASAFILREYSLEREERDIVSFWKAILKHNSRATV